MIKRIVAIITILAVLLESSNVYAVVGNRNTFVNKDMVIVPLWENAQKITPVISFSSGMYSGQISGNSDVTKIVMTVVLSVKK